MSRSEGTSEAREMVRPLLPSEDFRRGLERNDVYHQQSGSPSTGHRTLDRSRIYALVAVCTMSIGSHFAMYQLGPLKSRLHRELHTSNAQFSLLIAAFNLNSTWTPLVAGLFVARFGTGWSSGITTGFILLGQLILFVGVTTGHIVIMMLGLFIFGLGVTPLAVVQETLVSRLSPSKHLGLSLALGLVSGKMASFISSLVSLPLADKWGEQAPFGLSVLLCAGSFAGNAARLFYRWGEDVRGDIGGPRRKEISWGGVGKLGDVFWVYILLNFFSGMIWAPFLHLSANLVKERYGLSEGFAAAQAAILLSGALILYPITGLITDRLSPHTPRTTFRLILLSSTLTLSCYTFLSLPPDITQSPMSGLILFALGHGMATLLMVILVPRFLPPEMVPLGLGLHKSMEMASSAMSQTVSGMWLDAARERGENGGEVLLKAFWGINLAQLGCAGWLWVLEARRRRSVGEDEDEDEGKEYERLPMNDLPPLDSESDSEDESAVQRRLQPVARGSVEDKGEGNLVPSSALARNGQERSRSRVFLGMSLGWIGLVWVVFLVDAYMDLLS